MQNSRKFRDTISPWNSTQSDEYQKIQRELESTVESKKAGGVSYTQLQRLYNINQELKQLNQVLAAKNQHHRVKQPKFRGHNTPAKVHRITFDDQKEDRINQIIASNKAEADADESAKARKGKLNLASFKNKQLFVNQIHDSLMNLSKQSGKAKSHLTPNLKIETGKADQREIEFFAEELVVRNKKVNFSSHANLLPELGVSRSLNMNRSMTKSVLLHGKDKPIHYNKSMTKKKMAVAKELSSFVFETSPREVRRPVMKSRQRQVSKKREGQKMSFGLFVSKPCNLGEQPK